MSPCINRSIIKESFRIYVHDLLLLLIGSTVSKSHHCDLMYNLLSRFLPIPIFECTPKWSGSDLFDTTLLKANKKC